MKKSLWNDLMRRARHLATDKAALGVVVQKAKLKAFEHKGSLSKFWQELMALLRLLKAWSTGKYPKVPWKTMLGIIAGVLYFLNPFDIIPDFISVVGFLDDASVIAFVYQSAKKDIHKFLEWEKSATY